MSAIVRYVVLLRAINVGARTAPMADLRSACEAAGFSEVASYIASGNLVLSSAAPATQIETAVEGIITDRFGFHADTIVRSAADWAAYLEAKAFAEERAARPSQVHLCLAKQRPADGAAERLAERATLGERFIVEGDALWADFAGGVGRSKITPAILDRAVGASVTARNWNTVVKLATMSAGTVDGPTG